LTTANKETIKWVQKVWGWEEWLVNCSKYCCKRLYLDKGAVSSLHRHSKKQETFFALSGQTGLHIDGKDYMLNPDSRPKTVYPKQEHQFTGLSEGIVILEISTRHDEEDVIRISESQPSPKTRKIAFLGNCKKREGVKKVKPRRLSFLVVRGDIKKRVRFTVSQPKQ